MKIVLDARLNTILVVSVWLWNKLDIKPGSVQMYIKKI